MKAYEKWYKQNMYDRAETQKAWKAALEWALAEGGCGPACGYKDVIEEELNDVD